MNSGINQELSLSDQSQRFQILREWAADLSLSFFERNGKTFLGPSSHKGPLRVQRPFYPEGDLCHIYLLHPPGGMAPGDTLTIDLEVSDSAQVLVTTPSAGKIYGSDVYRHPQTQSVSAKVAKNGWLEWLPQETIVFDGAEGLLRTDLALEEGACTFGWDVICLGRPASEDFFVSGQCRQSIVISRGGKPLHIEHNRFEGGSALMAEKWGLQGATVTGTAYGTYELSPDLVAEIRDCLNTQFEQCLWGVTQKPGVFLVRYLGQSAMQCRDGFGKVWEMVRPEMLGRSACAPRIWNT